MPLDQVVDSSGIVRLAGTISGPDVGDVLYVQAADPGAVGAGKLWLDTSTTTGSAARALYVRNAANSAWTLVGLVSKDAAGTTDSILVKTGDSSGANAGDVLLQGGAAPNGIGGHVLLRIGDGDTYGSIQIQDDNGVPIVTVNQNGTTTFAGAISAAGQGLTIGSITSGSIGATSINASSGFQTAVIASGALPTTSAWVSGTGKQIAAARDVNLHVPVTFNPTAGAAATCTVAISPDNVTYSTLGVETEPVGVTFDGTIHIMKVAVPAGWYVKLTVVNAVIGTGTYY